MSQPFGLWGLPSLSHLPPELRKLVRARFRQLNFRSRRMWVVFALSVPFLVLWVVLLPSLLAALEPLPLMLRFAVIIPVALVFQFLPLLAMTPFLRANYRLALSENGLCTACGYDLRATPSRCPECGNVPAARAAT